MSMAEADPARGTEPTSDALWFHRRIEFHAARRPFNGLGNNGNGFKLVTLNPNTVSHKASGSDKKCEKTVDNYETGLDPELRLEITFRRIGAGLRNLGNTCFLNSVLQCLTYTEPLVAYLQSGKHQNSCRTSGFCALCAIQKHVSRALQSTGRILEPKDLVSNLRCISRNFRIARQEDAHEYMVNLLESMHKCCLPSGVLSESPGAYEKSLVHKIFGGHLRSQVKCMQCSYCSNKFDPFLDLSLEIVKADSLVRALAHFTAKEQLDGGAKQYQCEQCRQKVKALKQLTIHKAPHVLTVHLKRFGSQSPGQKIDKKVTFGSTLDLKPFVTGSYDGDLTYTLYGVLVHAGWSTRSGHYYCFVRTSSGMWYSLDDNQVFQVNERKVLEQKAYMLFYVRDRKDFVPRKPVKVIPKENMLMGATGNEVYSKLDMELEGKMRNRTIDKKSDLSASLALSRRDSLLLGTQKGTTDSEILFPNGNGLLFVDYEGHKRGPHSEISLTAIPSNGPLKDHNILNSNSLDHIGGSIITGGDSVDTRNLNGAAENVSSSNVACVLDDLNASGIKLPEHIAPQDSANKKGSIDVVVPSICEKETAMENLCRMGRTNSGALGNTMVPMQIVSKEATEVKHMNSLQKSSIEAQSRAGGPSEKICVSSFEDNHENGQRVQTAESGMSSSLVGVTQNMQHEESKDRRPERKRKKKLLRCNVPAMSFTSNIIFGVGLGVRKKKPKQLRKEKKNLDNVSDANDLPSIPGPSMADKSAPSPDDSGFCLQKKNSECGSNGKKRNLSIQNMSGDSCSVLSDDVINNNCSERVSGETTLFSERQPLRNPIDVMSMLMKGLDETTVAGWDDIHVSLSEELETRATRTTAQIGFVGDEWDEEYDRGKRKKLRSCKIDFSGPNLFQEIAAKNSMRKAAKLNRALNQPFRI